jgi:hypothetical protein
LCCSSIDFTRHACDLLHGVMQAVHKAVHARRELPDLIASANVDAFGEVAIPRLRSRRRGH